MVNGQTGGRGLAHAFRDMQYQPTGYYQAWSTDLAHAFRDQYHTH